MHSSQPETRLSGLAFAALVVILIIIAGCRGESEDYRERLLSEIAAEHGEYVADRVRKMAFYATADAGADLLLLQAILDTGVAPHPDVTDADTWRAVAVGDFPKWKSPRRENLWQLQVRVLGPDQTRVAVLSQRNLPAQPPWDVIASSLQYAAALADAPLPERYGNAVLIIYGGKTPAQAQAANHGSHIAIRNAYRDRTDVSGWILAHEIAHLWWRHNAPYIDEGMGELTAYLASGGRHRPAQNATPCEYDTLDPWPDRRPTICDYDLGGDLFYNLMRLDYQAFTKSVRHLYRATPGAGLPQLRQTFRTAPQQAIISRYLPLP